MSEETPNAPGVVDGLHRLVAALFAIVQNRLELATVEISEEKTRWLGVLFWGAAFFFLIILAAIFLTLAVVAWLVEPFKSVGVVLAAFGFGYLLAAGGTLMVLYKRSRAWPPLLAETIAEIKKDRACFLPPKL